MPVNLKGRSFFLAYWLGGFALQLRNACLQRECVAVKPFHNAAGDRFVAKQIPFPYSQVGYPFGQAAVTQHYKTA